jgi:hypothetical protein
VTCDAGPCPWSEDTSRYYGFFYLVAGIIAIALWLLYSHPTVSVLNHHYSIPRRQPQRDQQSVT